MRFARAILFCVSLLIPCLGFAQVTGPYAFGPFDNYGFDSVNRGNLDVHFSIPIFSKPGRGGTSFHYALNYDGLVWTPQTSSGAAAWTPAPEWGWTDSTNAEYGYVTYHLALVICGYIGRNPPQPEYQLVENNYVYHDSHGVPHSIPYGYTSTCGTQGTDQTSGSYVISDNSGFTAYRNRSAWNIVSSDGTEMAVPSFSGKVTSGNATVTDTNGNEISVSSSGTFTDTMGKTALTVSGSAPNPVVYTYTDSNGASQQVTVNYGSYTVQTDFGVSGITEYSGSSIPLVSSIVFSADGTSYSFAYEATPNNSAAVTGRIASVTLRTGGTIQYAYTGGSNGIESDGTTAGLSRTTSDGTISYSRSNVTSSSSTTTTTDATQNQTVSQFLIYSGYFFETDHAVYSGSAGGTPLSEVQTCYNASGTCSGGSVSSPISSLQTTTLQNGIQTDRVYNTYTGVGLLQSSYDTDTGITTSSTYNQYTDSLGIPYYRIASTSTTPQGQGVSSETTYAYDETTPTATSGLPQHVSVSSSRGNLTSVHQWLNSSGNPAINTTTAYDDAGQVLSQTDTNNDVTSYTYDSATDTLLSTVTYPQVNGTRFTASLQMDPNTGLVTSFTDINSQPTTFSYDGSLRPTQVLYPDNGKTTYGYSQNQTSIYKYQNSGTHTDTEVLVDGYGRQSRVAIANGQSTNPWYQQDTCYDANGNVGFTSYRYQGTGLGAPPVCSGSGGDTFSYDALHRLIKTTHGDNTVVTQSYTGTATETTDENGVRRIVSTMAPGLIGAVCEISSNSTMPGSGSPVNCNMNISGTGFLTSYAYDFVNHKVTITQGGQSRIFQNDWAGRPILVQEPESGQTTYSYAYNATGLVVTRQRPTANQSNPSTLTATTTQYDALGRPTSISYSDGTIGKNYTYDAGVGWGTQSNLKGRLSAAALANNTAATVYGYDAMGRVTNLGECDPSNCGTSDYSTAYSYDEAGNMLTSTDGGGNTDTYNYSPANEVQSITSSLNDANHPPNLLSNVQYGPFGPLEWQLGNGLGVAALYDGLGRQVGNYLCSGTPSVDCQNSTQIFGFWIAMQGQRVSEACTGPCTTYGYDEFNRLSSSNLNNGQQAFSWTYDRWGNRWQQNVTAGTGPAPQLSFNTSTNQIATSGYAYDAAGNMTSDGTHTYTYDAEGNMTKVDSGSTATYTYDALNQRVRIDSPSGGIEYVFNPMGQHTSSFNAANHAVSADWMFWGASQFAVYSNNQTLFDQHDWVGTERMRTDAQGHVNGSFQSLPYGDGYTVSGNDWDQYHFAGMDQDSSSNDHAQFRGYSNMAGRWTSPDPYSGSYDFNNPQSLNRYAYVMNNPLSYSDPTGLDWACSPQSLEGGGWVWNCWWITPPSTTVTVNGNSDGCSPTNVAACPPTSPYPPINGGVGGNGSGPTGYSGGNSGTPTAGPGTSDFWDKKHTKEWWDNVKKSWADDAKKKPSWCATASLSTGVNSLMTLEAPPVSAGFAVVSLGFGAADYFGLCK